VEKSQKILIDYLLLGFVPGGHRIWHGNPRCDLAEFCVCLALHLELCDNLCKISYFNSIRDLITKENKEMFVASLVVLLYAFLAVNSSLLRGAGDTDFELSSVRDDWEADSASHVNPLCGCDHVPSAAPTRKKEQGCPTDPHKTKSPTKRPTKRPSKHPTNCPATPHTTKSPTTRAGSGSDSDSGRDSGSDSDIDHHSGRDSGRDNDKDRHSGRDTGSDNDKDHHSGRDSGSDSDKDHHSGRDSGSDNDKDHSGKDTGSDGDSDTLHPTAHPTRSPTAAQTRSPTAAHTLSPTAAHTRSPTAAQTRSPTAAQTLPPTAAHTRSPTAAPTRSPTAAQTLSPTAAHTLSPTAAHTLSPIAAHTLSPTAAHTLSPTAAQTLSPTAAHTLSPTAAQTLSPTAAHTLSPTTTHTSSPTKTPSYAPTDTPLDHCLVSLDQQTMEGNLELAPGSTIGVGYQVKDVPAGVTVSVTDAGTQLNYACSPDGSDSGTIVLDFPDAVLGPSAVKSDLPVGGQSDDAVWQVPMVAITAATQSCFGGSIWINAATGGVSFSAQLLTSPAEQPNMQFHYRRTSPGNPTSGSWSASAMCEA
jgi:hypothetical protein